MRPFLLFTLLAISSFCFSADAATVSDTTFPTKMLSIRWQPVTNEYKPGTGASLHAIIVTNHSTLPFPKSGWKLYFNSSRLFNPVSPTENVRIELVNGDLLRMIPTDAFKGIAARDTARIEYVSDDPIVNFTDGPEGFYIVWDAFPDKGFATGPFTTGAFSPDYAGLVTPEMIYQQNKLQAAVSPGAMPAIFPTPMKYQATGGQFTFKKNWRIEADSPFVQESKWLQQLMTERTSFTSGSTSMKGNGDTIALIYRADIGKEGYRLSVTANGIRISASTAAGIFYGIQSLKSLMPATAWSHPGKTISIPTVEVSDEPRFAVRAFMLDVGRNFQPKKEILRLIDLMALYKLNTFHFHLTEDEGWRLALPSLPELTTVGSQRGHTPDSKSFLPPSHGSGPDTGILPGSGFYTRTDFIEILRYARERHILVIPEIETPGHARAAIKSMHARYERLLKEGKPDEARRYLLYDLNDSSHFMSVQNWNDNIMDVSLPSTYRFIETVINDIADIYREAGAELHTIHFGGDEVPAHVWEHSPAYIALRQSNPEIKNTNDCWYYFYGRINKLLQAKGLFLSGWEEMGLRKTTLDGRALYIPNPDFTQEHLQTDVWNNTLGDGNEDLAYKMANAGYKVLLTCVTHMYFDMAEQKTFDEPGYYWGSFIDLEKPFSFIPYDYFKNSTVDKNGLPLNRNIFIGKQRLTAYGKSNIVGLQSAIWAETIKSTERLEFMLLPRLLSFAERAWQQDPDWATNPDTAVAKTEYQQALSGFLETLGLRELPRLSYYNGGYAYRISPPGVHKESGKYYANDKLPGFVIRYDIGGKDPDINSKLYQSPVPATGRPVRFRTFDAKGRGSHVIEIN